MANQQTPPEESPLTEVDPKSIDELFAADPLDLTDDDVARIVTEFRKNRDKWQKEETEAQNQGRARRPSKYKKKPPNITIADLGLVPKK